MTTTRRATQDDVERWYGAALPWTLRGARIWEEGSEPRALAGYYVQGGRAVVFAEIRASPAEVRRAGRSVLRGARALLAEVRTAGLPACATADPDWPTAGRLLTRLGFVRFGDVWARP